MRMVTQVLLAIGFVGLMSFGAPVTAKAQITVTALGEEYNECSCRYRHHRNYGYRDRGYSYDYDRRGYGYERRGYDYDRRSYGFDRRGYGYDRGGYDSAYDDSYSYDEYEAYRQRAFNRWVAHRFYFYKDIGDSPQFRNNERAYNVR